MTMTIEDFIQKYGYDSTSNFQLLSWAKDLGIKWFFCVMRNELGKLKKIKQKQKGRYYIICNYQTTKDIGTHWTALYKDIDKAYFFDPYGIQPFPEAIEFLDNGIYSTFRIQPEASKLCGILCLFVLYKLSRGEHFYDIILNLNDYRFKYGSKYIW